MKKLQINWNKLNFLTRINFKNLKLYWPYFIFGIFVITILINIAYVFIARDSWFGIFKYTDTQKDQIGTKGIEEKIKEQRKLGIQINTTIKNFAYNRYGLETFVSNNKGEMMNDLKVLYVFKNIDNPQLDFSRWGQTSTNIVFYDEFSLPSPGKWYIETKVTFLDFTASDLRAIILEEPKNEPTSLEEIEKNIDI